MLHQISIFHTTIADLLFSKFYIANVLVNPQGQLFIFYKMDMI